MLLFWTTSSEFIFLQFTELICDTTNIFGLLRIVSVVKHSPIVNLMVISQIKYDYVL